MRRFALFAVFQCLGAMAFCQSPAISSGSTQASPVTSAAPQSRFTLDGSSFGPGTSAGKSGKADSCRGTHGIDIHMNDQLDAKKYFHVPCMDVNAPQQFAHMVMPPSPLQMGPRPGLKSEPIPTQWPNTKIEQIPTTWPKLKIQQIQGNTANSAPAK
jgi:hypothetical protein